MRFFILSILFISACATVKSPTGGPKDETPPQVLRTYPDSAQTNISPAYIELEFDEYVRTKEVSKLLIISPNPASAPEISIKKKTLIITFNEELQENTTYSIMINGSVVDNNEGNPLEDYQLTFSTGDYIDSLKYRATIIDAFTKEACDHCVLYMYRTLEDSLPLLARPDYLARTKGSGQVQINFLPPDSFTAFALNDENKNLKLDDKEQISVKKIISTDSSGIDTFYIFPYRSQDPYYPKLLRQTYPGRINFSLERSLDRKDSIKIWLKKNADATDSVLLDFNLNQNRDTILSAVSVSREDTLSLHLSINDHLSSYTYNPKDPGKSFRIKSISAPYPGLIQIKTPQLIDSVNFSQITLESDSIPVVLDSFSYSKDLVLLYFKARSSLKIFLNKGSLQDINGSINKLDSAILIDELQNSANLTLNVALPDSNTYIIQLLTKDQVVSQNTFTKEFSHTFSYLKPGNYRFRIITDLNNNGIWDTGDFINDVYAEPLFLSSNVELRVNWDKELVINTLD